MGDEDGLVESWVEASRGSRRLCSDHAAVEAAYALGSGHRPGEPAPLGVGKPVPGCGCFRCTGVLARRPRRRWRGPLPVDEARAVSILDVCDRLGLALRRVGKSYRGPCPIHGGDGPNFSVVPERGCFRCWVCGERGDGIRLVQLVRGLTFVEAVREVAA